LNVKISKAGHGKYSPFVTFICRLQKRFPNHLRAFHINNSISKELTDVRPVRSKRDGNLEAQVKKIPLKLNKSVYLECHLRQTGGTWNLNSFAATKPRGTSGKNTVSVQRRRWPKESLPATLQNTAKLGAW
jgi:hypothetical protein